MSIITDEVLAAMANARIKARKSYAVSLSTFDVRSLMIEAENAGIPFEEYSGDLLALIEVLVEYTFPQLVTESATRDAYEPVVKVDDEVSNWFSTGEAAAQASAYLTPDVIKLNPQPMTTEYRDLGVNEVRSGLCNVLDATQVAGRIRSYMSGHWPDGTVDRIIQVALANNGNMPTPVSEWPQAGPADEPTMLTPIIEPTETEPSREAPTYYGPMMLGEQWVKEEGKP